MKSVVIIFFIFTFSFGYSQHIRLLIRSNNDAENQVIDSISYAKKFSNFKLAQEEASQFRDRLIQNGFLETEITETKKNNDSTLSIQFDLGKKVKTVHLYIGNLNSNQKEELFKTKNDTLKISFQQLEPLLNNSIKKLEEKGFSFARVKLKTLNRKNNNLIATLELDDGVPRTLNNIVINGVEKFPDGYKKSIMRHHKNKTFNQDLVRKIDAEFNSFKFVKSKKYPEILFTKDSTTLYIYLEKSKSNRFDGFIGFSNSKENKVNFIGNLDLSLSNTLHLGEELSLFWKSDGNNQTSLNVAVDFPYLFKSPLGLKSNLSIFRRDSLFQNTKKSIDLGYLFSYSSRVYIGYQSTSSTAPSLSNSSMIGSYDNDFVTTQFEYGKYNNASYMFPEKLKVTTQFGIGSRTSENLQQNQIYIATQLKYILELNVKNQIYINSPHYFLKSDQYITNELYRFGGIQSIRGFAENSLQANQFHAILTEYRYLVSPSLFVHSITDYGIFTDKSTQTSDSLLGLGFGFGILTKNGLLRLIYANGSTKNQDITLSNSIVHLSFKSYF